MEYLLFNRDKCTLEAIHLNFFFVIIIKINNHHNHPPPPLTPLQNPIKRVGEISGEGASLGFAPDTRTLFSSVSSILRKNTIIPSDCTHGEVFKSSCDV